MPVAASRASCSPSTAQGTVYQYPFDFDALGEPGFGSFDKQTTGGKVFDFNVDGLAHIGLLPDLVADLAQVGLPSQYVDQMFLSAEQFIRTWEKSAGVPSTAPTCIAGCGNGQLDPGEDCDGPDLLNGATCQSRGFPGGQLACDASCHFDTSGCLTQVCGNGVREGTEACDDGASNDQPGDCCSASCESVADDTSCASDQNECTADVCRGGTCAHPPVTDRQSCTDTDGDQCTAASCQSGQCDQRSFAPDGTACASDQNECTTDVCSGGACAHPPVTDGQSCTDTDGDVCTAASCQSGQCDQRTFAPDETACASDQDDCTDDLCGSGICTHPAVPRAATFLSIDCRLDALRATVQSDTTGRVQRTLLSQVDKVIASKHAAETAAAAGNRIRARSRLQSASHRLVNFAHRVVSLAGRKNILPQPVATDLLAQQAGILEDVGILQAQFR